MEKKISEDEQPRIVDYGDLVELTAASLFFGTDDSRAKVNPNTPAAFFS